MMIKMKTAIAMVIIGIFLVTAVAYAQLGPGPWPKYKANLSNNGRSPVTVIAKPKLKWATSLTLGGYTAGGASPSGPFLDEEGNVYVMDTGDPGKITKLDANGNIIWRSEPGFGYCWGTGAIWKSNISAQKYVVAGPGYSNPSPGLYAIDPVTGATAWSVPLPRAGSDSAPTIGPDGTIYCHTSDGWGSGEVHAIDPVTKTIKWTYGDLGSPGDKNIGYGYGSAVLTTIKDDTGATKNLIIIAGLPSSQTSDSIYALRDDGNKATLLWSAPNCYHWNQPVLSNDGKTVYIIGFRDWGPINAFAFNVADGTKKWEFESTTNTFSTPVIGADGTIYVGGQNGRVVAIKDNGTSASIKWALDLPDDLGECTTPAIISTNPPVIYIGTYSGRMYAIRDDGTKPTILWMFAKCPGSVQHTPAVGADGTVFCQWHTEVIAFEPGFIGEGAKIKGQVLTPGGYGIAGAYVGYSTSPRPLPDNWYPPVRTDINGFFEIKGLASGTYYVAAWAPGFAISNDATVVLPTDTSVQNINFTLYRSGANVALGAMAYSNAESGDPAYAPAKAVDGSLQTRFASIGGQMPVYLLLDLGSDITVSEAIIYWENAYGTKYSVQCMTSEWSPEFDWDEHGVTVYTTECGNRGIKLDNSRGIDLIKFEPKTAAYWRIYVEKANGNSMSVWEFELNSPTQLEPPNNKISELEEGGTYTIAGKIVTAAPNTAGVPLNVFYIEEPDRSAGIRVESTAAVDVGRVVTVTGTVATNAYGEKYIIATSVTTGIKSPVGPLGMNLTNASSPLATGLLIRTAGTVKAVGSNYFMLTDGSTFGPVKVYTGGAPAVTPNTFVTINGIVSLDANGVCILQVP